MMTTATLPPPVPLPAARLTWTLDEVAERLGVSRKTISREADGGHLRTVKIRGRRLVKSSDLENYLAGLSGSSAQ